MAVVNYQRIIDAVNRSKKPSMVYVNDQGGISVTTANIVGMMKHMRCQRCLSRVIGVYQSPVNPQWIEEDLEALGIEWK